MATYSLAKDISSLSYSDIVTGLNVNGFYQKTTLYIHGNS